MHFATRRGCHLIFYIKKIAKLVIGPIRVVAGGAEERLTLGHEPSRRTFAAGEAFHFSPADIHRVRHDGSDPAVTLHVYSPPLARMGAYSTDEYGALVRHSISSSQELRPLALAA